MPFWIIATLAAASFQTLRFALQKVLAGGTLSASGATFARFLYSAPLVVAMLGAYLWLTGTALPPLSGAFWIYGAAGGASQILATVFTVLLMQARNFAVGMTFKKTEAIQAVLVGLIVLGEGVSAIGFAFISLGVVGVLLLSDPPKGAPGAARPAFWSRFANRAAALGLGSGVLFAVSGVCYRAASLELGDGPPMLRAAITLGAVTSMQMVAMALWLRWRAPGEISRVWAARARAGLVGLTSMAGSYGWFTAFSLQTVAYVKALGQIEILFSLAIGALFFHERITRREGAGIAILVVSILGLILVL